MISTEIHFGNGYIPFQPTAGRTAAVRGLRAAGGVGDRLRLVAFAELQARDLFLYGSEAFAGAAPEGWRARWRDFAAVEDRHAQLLLSRMTELGVEPGARTVSDKLSRLCRAASDPFLFLFLLSSAEERGMEAGFALGDQMREVDPISAALFARIAEEEVEHVEAARSMLAGQGLAELQGRARLLSSSL